MAQVRCVSWPCPHGQVPVVSVWIDCGLAHACLSCVLGLSCLSSRFLFASSFSPTSLLSSSVHAGLLILGSPVRNHDACLAGCVILCSSRAFWLAHVWYGSCLLACLCVSVLGRSSLVTVLSLACCLSNRAPCSLHGWLSNQAPCSLAGFLIDRPAHWLAF
jgi:hypothetical protein